MLRRIITDELSDNWELYQDGVDVVESWQDGNDIGSQIISAESLYGSDTASGTSGRDAPEPSEHTGPRARAQRARDDSGDDDEIDTQSALSDMQNGQSQCIAVHESGAQIYVAIISGVWLVDVTQEVSTDGIRAHVTTHADAFDTESGAMSFIEDIADDIDAGDERLDAFAAVAHQSTPESASLEHLNDADGELAVSDEDILFDIFTVSTAALADETTIDHVASARKAIVAETYGIGNGLPSVVADIDNDDIVPIQVFSVTADEVDTVGDVD